MTTRGVVGSVALAFVLGLAPAATATAQRISVVSPGNKNTVGGAASFGLTIDGESWLWGVSTDYTRLFAERWVWNVSLAYDRETTKREGGPDEIYNSFTLQYAMGYVLTPRITVGAGFGKGLVANKVGEPGWNTTKLSEDWATGVVFAYAFYATERHAIDFSTALEYRINDRKFGWSCDVGYGYSF